MNKKNRKKILLISSIVIVIMLFCYLVIKKNIKDEVILMIFCITLGGVALCERYVKNKAICDIAKAIKAAEYVVLIIMTLLTRLHIYEDTSKIFYDSCCIFFAFDGFISILKTDLKQLV